MLLILVVGLLVIGPERLPETVRTLGLWMGRLRRSFSAIKSEIDKEVGMDEIRRQLHNEAVMEEMKRIEAEVQNSIQGPTDSTSSAKHDSAEKSQHHRVEETAAEDEADKEPKAPKELPEGSESADSASTQSVQSDAAEEHKAALPADQPSGTTTAELEPAPPLPRSEAELEALHASRQKAARDV